MVPMEMAAVSYDLERHVVPDFDCLAVRNVVIP